MIQTDASEGDAEERPDAGDAGPPEDVESDGDARSDVGSDAGPDAKADGTAADAGDATTADGSADADTGPGCAVDPDSDGLNNCEEQSLCAGKGTAPDDGDTDGDGLGDLEELQKTQTNPCKKDTDGDGASDTTERRFGLEPNSKDSYGDGTLDGERWILSACDDVVPEDVSYYENKKGNWTVALPAAFNNYRDTGNKLTLQNAKAPQAVAVYGDPPNEVAGFLLSKKAEQSQNVPADAVKNRIFSVMKKGSRSIKDPRAQGGFDTHNQKRAARANLILNVGSEKSVRRVRDELLHDLAPFSKSDLTGLPPASGATYKSFHIRLAVIFRKNTSGRDQSLISLAIGPQPKYAQRDKVRFRMDDLTNTTNISEQVDHHLPECTRFQPDKQTPRAEFYWVLDQSGSMRAENSKVKSFAKKFEQRVQNTALDYRHGVTNMAPANSGRLQVPPGWHKSPGTFQSQVQNRVINCQQTGGWNCHGSDEYGLKNATQGIRYMRGLATNPPKAPEKVRSNAQVISIFMSDEHANSIEDKMRNGLSYQQAIGPYKRKLRGRTTAFAIVTDGSCGEDARAYRDIALATGGKSTSLCKGNLTKMIKNIIVTASGLASKHKLPKTPISNTLQVFVDGQWVPRSRKDGYDYFPQSNSLAFFGKYRPKTKKQAKKGPGDFIAVHYETFIDRCKENS
ncbi:MAG: hypothetical protein ABEL76_04160, partial [Bradymonadaceae bacterium]